MDSVKIVHKEDLKWEPHPQLANVEVSYLVSHRDEKMDLTCMLVHLPPGTDVPKHTHECDDILYVVKGKAKIWLDGIGEGPDDVLSCGIRLHVLQILSNCFAGDGETITMHQFPIEQHLHERLKTADACQIRSDVLSRWLQISEDRDFAPDPIEVFYR